MIESDHSSEFAEEISFQLTVESDSPIEAIALYRQLAGEIVRARTDIEFTPGTRVEAVHVWQLEPGELVPGAEVQYHWVVEDRAGHSLTTPTVAVLYEDDRFQWRRLSRGELDLAYYDRDDGRAQEILDSAWGAVEELRTDAGLSLDRRVTIYVYANERDMRPLLSPRGSIYDDQTLTLGVAAGADTLILLGSHRDVLKTVTHEISHIVVGLATENPYVDLPRWLDEGLAMYAEGELPANNARALERGVLDDRLISVRSLSAYVGDPGQVDLFYAQVYSLVEFMIDTYGDEALFDLLANVASGVPAEAGLERVYGLNLDGLDEAWRASQGLGPRVSPEQWPESSADSRGAEICGSSLAMVLGSLLMIAAVGLRR